MSEYSQEPSIHEKLKWPLAALWISLGLHGALIALVQITPLPSVVGPRTIEARLVSAPKPVTVPQFARSIEANEALAVDVSEAGPKVEPEAASSSESPIVNQIPPSLPESMLPRLEIPVAVDLHYYPARELDEPPRGSDDPPSGFPDFVLSDVRPGKIQFQVKIEENGRVSEVVVVGAYPPEHFDQAALDFATEALRATHFVPGIKNGQPVRALVIYELMINSEPAKDPAPY